MQETIYSKSSRSYPAAALLVNCCCLCYYCFINLYVLTDPSNLAFQMGSMRTANAGNALRWQLPVRLRQLLFLDAFISWSVFTSIQYFSFILSIPESATGFGYSVV